MLCAASGVQVSAQDRTLSIGVTDAAPFLMRNVGGAPSGFVYDLAALLAEELSLELQIKELENVRALYAAQARGETDMNAGIARIPALEESNVFTESVAYLRTYMFVRAEDSERYAPETASGLRIGVIERAPIALPDRLTAQNTILPIATPEKIMFDLLAGDLDAAVMPNSVMASRALKAQVGYRFAIVGEAVANVPRVVALNKAQADLLPAVSEALAKFEADGRLPALRAKYFLDRFDPVPDVLLVGVRHFPPYQIVEADGSYSGFAVEVLKGLAERASLELEFTPISPEEFGLGPGAGGYDLLPQAAINAERRARMDFTLPIETSVFSIFVRKGDADGISGLSSLAGRKVGVGKQNLARRMLEASGIENLLLAEDANALIADLREGRVEAIVYPRATVLMLAETNEYEEEITEIMPAVFIRNRAPALRLGLGATRERINAVTPAYLISEEYLALREKYFGTPRFWTEDRLYFAYAIAGALALSVIAAFVLQSVAARRKSDALMTDMQAASSRLSAVMDAAQSGVIGLSRDGDIELANTAARHMLGGLSAALPVQWPREVRFLDGENMAPLDASSNPIERALAGQDMRGQITVMSRAKGMEPRYVRVSSSTISETASKDIRTVLVMDDVTEQERNRQKVERAGRLDALGQLTGGIAHDFNNLLATIEYSIQLSRAQETPGAAEQYFSTALSSVRRGAELTGRLLAFAKKQPTKAQSTLANVIMSDMAGLVGAAIEENIQLAFETLEPDVWVHCDVAQLENALLNLILNARDAIMSGKTGDRIVVAVRGIAELDFDHELRREDPSAFIAKGLENALQADHRRDDGKAYRFVEFSVTDNGPGMTEETKRRALDPFFTTKDPAAGTGLGLSMVYGFVQNSDGELRIYSEPGLGTTVRLILPRGTQDGAREVPIEMLPRSSGKGQRILIVEDEADLLAMMSSLVESLGYDVVQAKNANEAMDVLRAQENIELMLTDIVMPGGMGGFELAQKAREVSAQLRIVYMSGYTGYSEAEMGALVAPLIGKPCPPTELADVLKNALKARAT